MLNFTIGDDKSFRAYESPFLLLFASCLPSLKSLLLNRELQFMNFNFIAGAFCHSKGDIQFAYTSTIFSFSL